MINRYARQTVLPEIGEEGQRKITRASVLCIGAGGLGCPALLYLAAAGVGHIGIVDFDDVDETNLQRQVLYRAEQVGQKKAEVAKERLLALNPEIRVEAFCEALNADNAVTLFEQYDIILDGSDNFATKFLINDAAVKTGKPFVYGSILGFEGQVGVFNYQGGPCYRCLFPHPPKHSIPNCAEAGVIGAVAGIVGTTQAVECIKLIVGHEAFKPLSNRLWVIDSRDMGSKLLELDKDPDCPVCLLDREDIVMQTTPETCVFVEEISVENSREAKECLFLDVREQEEWDAGHIEGSQHFALSAILEGAVPDMDKDSDIIVYCAAGVRSLHAAQILKQRGFQRLKNMTGGYQAWCSC